MPKQRTSRTAAAARRGAGTSNAVKDITAPTHRRKPATQTALGRETRSKRTTRAKGVSPEGGPYPTSRPSLTTPHQPSEGVRRTISEPSDLQHHGQEASRHQFLTKWLEDAHSATDSYEHVGTLFDGYATRLGDSLTGDNNDTGRASYRGILSEANQIVETTNEAVRGLVFESVPFQDEQLHNLENNIQTCQARLGDAKFRTEDELSKNFLLPPHATETQSKSQTTRRLPFRPQYIKDCCWRGCTFASNLYRLKTHILQGHTGDENAQDNYTCLWEDDDLCGKRFMTLYSMKEHIWLEHLGYDDSTAEDGGVFSSLHTEDDKVQQVDISASQEALEQSGGALDIVKSGIFGALSYISPFKSRSSMTTDSGESTPTKPR